MLCVVFGLSLLDRTNISAAYIAGMAVDLELTVGARYSIALLVFFIGQYSPGSNDGVVQPVLMSIVKATPSSSYQATW
jgi:hypothetical protein